MAGLTGLVESSASPSARPIWRSTYALICSSIRDSIVLVAGGAVVFSGLLRDRRAVDGNLVDVLVLDVLQVLFAEVVHRDAVGDLIAEQRACRLRDRIWPPCPAAEIRAARTTSIPR